MKGRGEKRGGGGGERRFQRGSHAALAAVIATLSLCLCLSVSVSLSLCLSFSLSLSLFLSLSLSVCLLPSSLPLLFLSLSFRPFWIIALPDRVSVCICASVCVCVCVRARVCVRAPSGHDLGVHADSDRLVKDRLESLLRGMHLVITINYH